MNKINLSLCLVVLLSACATTGYFKGVPLDEIEVGSTTEREVRALLGPPNNQELNEFLSGNETVI